MQPTLTVLSGPLSGRLFPLGPEGLSVGRLVDNDLQVNDPAVSRRHCLLAPEEGGFLLRDLGSRRGTFVNGQPVQERRLENGDLIAIGDTLLLFQLRPGGAPRAEPRVLLDDGDLIAGTTIQLTPQDSLWTRPGKDLAARAGADASGRIARDFQTLLRIATTLQSARSTAGLARALLELILNAIPGDRAALLLTDRGAPELADAFVLDRRGGTDSFPVSRTVVRQVLDGTALLAGDVLSGDLASAESLQASRVRALLAAPVAHLGRGLGLLYVDALTQEPPGAPLDQEHLEVLTALGGIAAGALAGVRQMEWLDEENRRLAEGLAASAGGMVGESPRMREIQRLLRRAAASDSTVLLRGESGTGKEVAARTVHQESPRRGRPFVAINCATLSESLLESELFGHEKGAFTGAVARKIGKAEAADGGTLFLDEVGELPLPLQAKLLRFLQEREFERVGGTRPIRVDVRVVAATNRDLEKAIREGTFREDLFYRLSVIPLYLPPLRERREDVPLLASHFAALISQRLGRPVAGFTPEARACLQGYDWPGNVRELANAVERAIVMGEGDLVRPEDLPETVLEAGALPGIGLGRYHEALHETKKRLIRAAVAEAGGNMTRAADLLGLQPTYLHRLINKLDLRQDLRDDG
ncbi:MAG TPA: sigma 54-interacting transcriptional regulator [Thermoanaerobaculia bacterium]|jgi:Nif-specific regulatory protein|nr:sigma 54-interacting transcriptional regulator [Thermoanaerobaculia bacterium]